MGTAGYMSPEQVRGEKLDARTDLFSFGLVLYEMATGQRAFSGDTAAILKDAILNQQPIPVRELNSALPAKLVSTIDKALEKDREQRYQTASDMQADLEILAASNPAWTVSPPLEARGDYIDCAGDGGRGHPVPALTSSRASLGERHDCSCRLRQLHWQFRF